MPSDPIFVKVRNDKGEHYGSYDIINQLIDWNFETCELDDVEPMTSKVYIFVPNNGNVKACCERPHTARYILWNLEIPLEESVPCPEYFDEMWVSDKYFASIIPNKGKFVILGGDERLAKEPSIEKRWDFCHLAYLYGKREEVVSQLQATGYTMAPVGFGDTRDEAIAKSRWGLCLHQNPVPAMSPQRMTLFGCRKLPIVLESGDSYPYKVLPLQQFQRQPMLEEATYNFDLLTIKHPFRQCVLEAL